MNRTHLIADKQTFAALAVRPYRRRTDRQRLAPFACPSLPPTHERNCTMLERVITRPDPYEPFLLSQGIRFGDLLFISGQAGAGDDGKIVPGGFRAQGEQAFAN